MSLRGIRGAITVDENSREQIWQAARQLVTKIMSANGLRTEDVSAMIFSSTQDLTAAFPSTGVRQLSGLKFVPLFDTLEPAIENSLPLCIRVLILADIDKKQNEVCHVYLEGAKNLRPDLDRD